MIPPAPLPFAAFGTVWYGGLFCGLCRVLAAPWLDPWWLARATESERAPTPERASERPPREAQQQSAPPAPLPPPAPAREATIIPFELARARAAGRKATDR